MKLESKRMTISDSISPSSYIYFNKDIFGDDRRKVIGDYWNNLISSHGTYIYIDDQEWCIDEAWKQSHDK